MLDFSPEDWALLNTSPLFRQMLEQMRREYEDVRETIARRGLLDADSAERTAINYALNCGRLEAIRDILEYKPMKEEEGDDV